MKKIAILSASIILILNSCIEKYDYQKLNNKPIPVVNCFFTNDSIFKVWIGITSDTLLATKPQLEVTKAYIKNNKGNIINLHNVSKNIYVSDSTAKKGIIYELIVETKDYGIISAQSSIPTDTITFVSNNIKYFQNQFDYNSQINIKYMDIANKPNYYQISLINKRFSSMSNDSFFNSISYKTISPIISKENINLNHYNLYCYTDKQYENQIIEIDLFANIYKEYKSEVVVIVKNTSKEYYLYCKSLSKYIENDPTGFDFENFIKLNIDPTLIQIYSNINGGLGIFAGFNINIQNILVPTN